MRPNLLAALLAAVLATACDRTKSMEEDARAAVSQALANAGDVTVDILHTNAPHSTVCGAATVQDAASGAAVRRPFIAQGGAVKLYHSPPDWNTIRELANMDSGGDQAAFRLQIDEGCAFPKVWKTACAPAASPIPPPDGELCRLWQGDQYQQLFDHVKQ